MAKNRAASAFGDQFALALVLGRTLVGEVGSQFAQPDSLAPCKSAFREERDNHLMGDGYDLQTMKQIEHDRFNLLTSKFTQDVAEKTKTSEHTLASKGKANSGEAIKQFVNIRVEAVNQLITDTLALRKEMIDRAPGLAATYELGNLKTRLYEYVDCIEHAVKSFVALNPRGGGRASVLSELPCYGAGLKQRIDTELRILENESKLPTREPIGTIHVTTGHGSNVVIGNVSNSILSTLRSPGNDELNKKLVELTEAIQQSNELTTEAKTEALVNLEFVVSQSVLEPGQRQKLTVIQSVWNSLAPILSVAADVAQIFSVAAPMLMKHLA